MANPCGRALGDPMLPIVIQCIAVAATRIRVIELRTASVANAKFRGNMLHDHFRVHERQRFELANTPCCIQTLAATSHLRDLSPGTSGNAIRLRPSAIAIWTVLSVHRKEYWIAQRVTLPTPLQTERTNVEPSTTVPKPPRVALPAKACPTGLCGNAMLAGAGCGT